MLHLLAAIVKIPIPDSNGFPQIRRRTDSTGSNTGSQSFGALRDWPVARFREPLQLFLMGKKSTSRRSIVDLVAA